MAHCSSHGLQARCSQRGNSMAQRIATQCCQWDARAQGPEFRNLLWQSAPNAHGRQHGEGAGGAALCMTFLGRKRLKPRGSKYSAVCCFVSVLVTFAPDSILWHIPNVQLDEARPTVSCRNSTECGNKPPTCGCTNLSNLLLAVTNKKPTQASITKVKQFEGSTSFVRRSQWMLEQLRQVNGIDPNGDSAEFDLLFENAFDQWVASTASEKCTFFQILHHTCQRYLTDRKPEFINCQSKIMGGNSILHSAADSVTSAVQKASQALNERGERLGRAEEKTEDLKNSAQQFAETAHKLAMKHKC
ncbi:PREDICTED: syntaxin-binding protein 6 [Mandrillus leucophaeus]|uniref:syntaxin-binding protein 6 n=1 Tax=Mandrillus leucophaeus TaxID=9568 RepID=UPI0005F4A987|nr:PREDICTED: syntaxin-binding protein 6 [Mandrillus leucophaeus]